MPDSARQSGFYLITGATDGIGKALASRLAADGATLIMHGRNKHKLEQAMAEIHSVIPDARLTPALADFASLEQVSGLAATITREHPDLNVLVNNAGHLNDHRQVSQDGFELTFAVNYLAPYLLTRLLLPLLRRNAPARIVNVSSTAMGGAILDFDDLQLENNFEGWQAYANSKLAQIYFTHTLAQQLHNTDVTCYSLCPGLIDTNFMHTNKVFSPAAQKRMQPMMRPAEQGADIPYYLATSTEVTAHSGHFFIREGHDQARPVPLAFDEQTAEQLWKRSDDYIAAWVNDKD